MKLRQRPQEVCVLQVRAVVETLPSQISQRRAKLDFNEPRQSLKRIAVYRDDETRARDAEVRRRIARSVGRRSRYGISDVFKPVSDFQRAKRSAVGECATFHIGHAIGDFNRQQLLAFLETGHSEFFHVGADFHRLDIASQECAIVDFSDRIGDSHARQVVTSVKRPSANARNRASADFRWDCHVSSRILRNRPFEPICVPLSPSYADLAIIIQRVGPDNALCIRPQPCLRTFIPDHATRRKHSGDNQKGRRQRLQLSFDVHLLSFQLCWVRVLATGHLTRLAEKTRAAASRAAASCCRTLGATKHGGHSTVTGALPPFTVAVP